MDVNICLYEHGGEFVHIKCLKRTTLSVKVFVSHKLCEFGFPLRRQVNMVIHSCRFECLRYTYTALVKKINKLKIQLITVCFSTRGFL